MDRNKRCWCRSGKKWKNCHRLRAEQKSLPESAFYARYFEEMKATKLCLHPLAPSGCSGTFSAAHTIQKRTGLSELTENQHILSARNRSPQNRSNLLNRIGINIASTFNGFCSDHDNHTFRPAEISSEPNEEVAFLLSYRALCFEIYMKKIAVQTLEHHRELLDRGTDFEDQSRIQQHLAMGLFGFSLGYEELMRLKESWDSALLTNDRSGFEWAFFQFDGLLPIATSGFFFPEYDFKGKCLQTLDAPVGSLASLGFNILPIGGKSCAIFGWLDDKTQNSKFIKTLREVPESHLASVLVQFAFDTSDNLFARQSWWENLDVTRKSYLEQNLVNSTPAEKWSAGLVPKNPPILSLPLVASR